MKVLNFKRKSVFLLNKVLRKQAPSKTWTFKFFILVIFIIFAGRCQPLQAGELNGPEDRIILTKALHLLSKKYEVFFSYDETSIANVKVQYSPEIYTDVEHALDQILRDTYLKYKIFDNRYIILYEENIQALSSLKGMVRHLESVINNQEKSTATRQKTRPIAFLDHTFKSRIQSLAFGVSGMVTDEDGEPLIGVNVQVKGTNKGTATDFDGNFTLDDIDENTVLIFSYIGYQKLEVSVAGKSNMNVILVSDAEMLDEVVVTALGVEKESRELTSAVSVVKGDEFTQSRENNVANALTGKIAGVNVSGLSTGPGGSSRVIIRGNGSLNGDNQPLYVINGMPMSNTHHESQPGISRTTLDQGDGIAAINPDDIESISVLKGGAAAALYGSRAANGVILITTKKGIRQRGIGVEVNSNFTIGTPSVYPDFQYIYGQGLDGEIPKTQAEARQSGRLSFGAKMNGQPYIQFDGEMRPYSPVNVKENFKNFYRPSTNLTNTVAFSGGKSQSLVYRLSLSDLEAKAIEPGSSYNRRTANLNIRSVLGDKLVIEAVSQYNLTNGTNRPGNGYADNTTSWAVNLLANTVDIRTLSPGFDEEGNEVKWNEVATAQNPYFVINRMGNSDSKNRFIGQANITYNFLDNLSIKATGMRDMNRFEAMAYLPIGAARLPRGTFFSNSYFETETTGQVLVNHNFSFLKNFKLSSLVGGSIEKNVFESSSHNGADFIVPEFISFNNLAIQSTNIGYSQLGRSSVFASADLNFKELLYISVTGRQDWFSVLNPGNNSIFYPSIGASFILSDALKLPSIINFAKLRTSWAQVGSATVKPYQINTTYGFLEGGFLGLPVQTVSKQLSNPDLRPLTSQTFEGGLNIEFLNGRLGLDVTYYDRVTTDDILPVKIAASSGYTTALLNAGSLSNKGIELLISSKPIRSDKFKWDASYNFAYNKSEILKLAPGLTSIGGSGVGNPYNTVRSTTYETNDQGQRVYNKISGYEVRGPLEAVGQGVPPFTMGFSNDFKYRNFSLSILIDGKFGNVVESQLSRYMYRFGLSKKTLPGRENGLTVSGVDETGEQFTKTWPVEQLDTYYNNQARISPKTTSIFDGSFVKLRSIILGYQIPVRKLNLDRIESINLSFVARNLAILYSKITDFDPETSYNISNNQGFVSNAIPRTRDIGASLIIKF